MLNNIKEYVLGILKSRLFVLVIVFIVIFFILVQRLFSLQIVHGDEYVNNFTLKIKKERTISGTRGLIYDCNGNQLAYNELAYSVQIEDNGSYEKGKKNEELNKELYQLIHIIEGQGDSLVDDFEIRMDVNGDLIFNVADSAHKRFLAAVYNKKLEKLTEEELNASPEKVFNYLCSEKKYEVSSEYSTEDALKILRIRFALSENNYQKYIATTVAEDVSYETVAVVKENSDILQGVSVAEVMMRKYVDSKYFSHIIGYTGRISTDELEELQVQNTDYEANDFVGKSGIEQYMETKLQGMKGSETLYVDNVGKVVELADVKDAQVGNDVYLTVDMNLQKAVYDIIEQKLAGILVSKIRNIKTYTATVDSKADDIVIPIDDVYFALFNNNIIKISRMGEETASETERNVYSIFKQKRSSAINATLQQLSSNSPTPYKNLNDEMQEYMNYVLSILTTDGVIKKEEINTSNGVYKSWQNGEISLKAYILETIAQNWLDITKISEEGNYTNSDETFQAIMHYVESRLQNNNEFNKKLFKYMIAENQIYGKQICLLLYDQGVLAYDETAVQNLKTEAVGAYDFLLDKINRLEITPAQLALDPCSGSCVITDVNTGEVLALVTYPSYDNNRLANSVDAEYYSSLLSDLSKPLYNRATQERNAPGSTFKMISAVAGLSENVITVGETIRDEREFKKINPSPKCWSTAGHGSVNVSGAIEHSCNYYFYEVGYRLSSGNKEFNVSAGIDKLKKYAQMFGLGEKSGIEITESMPKISDEDPVRSAIGQGNHNYANVQITRYVTAVANNGTCYNLSLLDKLTDSEGNLLEDYTPTAYNTISIPDSTWSAVHQGMRAVAARTGSLKKLSVSVAGKTGTAQENKLRPNHALFVGYAPYETPEIAMCVKISHGYTSANAAEVASDIINYYFNLVSSEQLLSGLASTPSSETIVD